MWTAMLMFFHKRAHLARCMGHIRLLMVSFDSLDYLSLKAQVTVFHFSTKVHNLHTTTSFVLCSTAEFPFLRDCNHVKAFYANNMIMPDKMLLVRQLQALLHLLAGLCSNRNTNTKTSGCFKPNTLQLPLHQVLPETCTSAALHPSKLLVIQIKLALSNPSHLGRMSQFIQLHAAGTQFNPGVMYCSSCL